MTYLLFLKGIVIYQAGLKVDCNAIYGSDDNIRCCLYVCTAFNMLQHKLEM